MKREEIFKHLRLDTNAMSTEELFRQTGRTRRMLAAAVKAANDGRPVVVVMKDMATVASALEIINKHPGVEVTHYNQLSKGPQVFSWSTLKGIGEYAGHEVFIDHDVIYFNNRTLFEAATKYDPKVEIKDDAMTFIREPQA